MDELKILVDMVANLPHMALWVLVGYLIYKVVVIGSIYGTIRFTVEKLHSYLTHRKVEYKEIRPMLDGMCIKAASERLVAQLHRVRGRGVSIKTEYIHEQSVDWLREAIDDKIAKDATII